MRLITGPAGSGKTASILDQFTGAIRSNTSGIRLLVPTATMAQHLQNRVAREGFVVRRNFIQTLSGFVGNWAADLPEAPEAVVYLLVEQAAANINRPEFRRVVHTPGFTASLARVIAEFSSAGCDSTRLAAALPESPLAGAFLAIYRELDRLLARRGLVLRARRLERAAERIRKEGLGEIKTIWLDGFHALPDPELAVLEALGLHAEVTLTLNESDGSDLRLRRLEAIGFRPERAIRSRAAPAAALVRARNLEREADEIARRILEQAASGRPFREMGIIVRAADTYVALLRSTLERFGIPARFYFDSDLEQHPVTGFLSGAIDAMMGGWDHAATLAVLRLAPRFADSGTMDRFEFAVREQIPNAGLAGLRAFLLDSADQPVSPGARRLLHLIDALAGLEEWLSLELRPLDWVARFRTLPNLFRPVAPPLQDLDRHLSFLWRTQAAVLKVFDEAALETAQALDPEMPLSLAGFWRALKSILRLKPLRLDDRRRNVVHVLSAHEAREWVLPVVFVCGMVEKQFPQFHPQDPFFPDAARCALNNSGILVRTAADFEAEERALFYAASTRATMLATFSYPEFDGRGERNLPSLFLEQVPALPSEPPPVRPEARFTAASPRPSAIHAPQLLAVLRDKTAALSPSSLESYLQCPFQYFGGRLLRLQTAPARPEERLDYQEQGTIVHEVLKEWYANPQEIGPLFERIFKRHLEERRIPRGYHTERLRNAMLEDLERFAADLQWPHTGVQSRVEQDFDFPLSAAVRIRGRIDRIDSAPDGRVFVIDYKYSAAQRVKEKRTGRQLQAPLYAIAAEKLLGARPTGMFFIGLKGGVEYAGWERIEDVWLDNATAETLRIASEIRSGRIAPEPASQDNCRFCDSRDVCRIDVRKPVAAAETA